MASSQAQATPLPVQSTDIYAHVDNYPWNADVEFLGGLSAILGPNPDESSRNDLTLRARCFYFSRKFNTNIDFDTYKAYYQRHHGNSSLPTPPASMNNGPTIKADPDLPPWTAPSAQVSTSAEPDAAPRLSYQEIVDLITEGKDVPGIRDIPETVLQGQGTTASAPRRRKPWEKNGEQGIQLEGM
ncbi:hypothetical protein EJ08DRAFT_586030 [Tothia fuscella]|uniref:Uncharacterized protein n=1 Tax=Tothia fuscella TaxID=1048955 RepID=A0A9P4NU25_9PEZI|nr:hypothetical protein EJ08DRAFT_586030 [Tothia fuscella]